MFFSSPMCIFSKAVHVFVVLFLLFVGVFLGGVGSGGGLLSICSTGWHAHSAIEVILNKINMQNNQHAKVNILVFPFVCKTKR